MTTVDPIKRLPPEMAALARAVLRKLRAQLPGAVEFVYDKANSLVIGFGPDDRPSHAITSIAVYRKWINLYFFEGGDLPDPENLLQGSGTMVRHVRITAVADVETPPVKAFIAEVRRRASPPLNPKARRRIIVRQARKS